MDELITGTQGSIQWVLRVLLSCSFGFQPRDCGEVGTVTVEALDAYGNRATEYSGTVAVTSTDNSAVLPASSGLTAGLGTFTVTLKTVGLQSISATDSVASTITGTQTAITVDPAAAFSFAVTGFPSPTTAGIAGTVSVEALDAYGNRATGYSGTVIITSTDGSATMPAPGSLIAGIGTFTVTLKTAGLSSITATDLATSTIIGTQVRLRLLPAL